MGRVQYWFLVGSKGHMHMSAATLFLAKQNTCVGDRGTTQWKKRVYSIEKLLYMFGVYWIEKLVYLFDIGACLIIHTFQFIFSRNNIFLSQQIRRNSISAYFFSEANEAIKSC